jgi:hypothetical protein
VLVVSILIFIIHDTHRPVFEAIMPAAIIAFTGIFAYLYFKKSESGSVGEGAMIGIMWLLENIIFDLLIFMEGPMEMSLMEYMADIGVTYLIIPIAAIAVGYSLEN